MHFLSHKLGRHPSVYRVQLRPLVPRWPEPPRIQQLLNNHLHSAIKGASRFFLPVEDYERSL
jgi:hypothetical protein